MKRDGSVLHRVLIRYLQVIVALVAPASVMSESLAIVTSINPLASIIKHVAAERVTVRSLVGASTDPHTFELTPGDLKALSRSHLIVLTHPGIEYWFDDLQIEMKERTLWLAQGVAPQHLDIHYWLVPDIAMQYAAKIRDKLCAIDRMGCEQYRRNAAQFMEDTGRLDKELQIEIGSWKNRSYVAPHPAWRAFSQHYGLQERAVLRESEGQQTTAREMANLITLVKKERISLFLVERTTPLDPLQSFISETGLTPVIVDSIGNDGEDYSELIKRNVTLLKSVMKE